MTQKTVKGNAIKGHVSALIYIGPTTEAVTVARDAILRIIAATQSETVACEGIKTLRKLCAVNHTTISNCTITG
jgi:hypothetical protein